MDIPFPRTNDKLIMTLFRTHTTCHETLIWLNRCRCYLNLLFLSDVVLADGKTVDPLMTGLAPTPCKSSYMFPPECPTKTDWVEWTFAWKSLLGRGNMLPYPLGDQVHDSHILWPCYYDHITDTIVETSQDSAVSFFIRPHQGRVTRRCTCYEKSSSPITLGDHPLRPASCLRVRPTRSSDSKPRRTLTCTGVPLAQRPAAPRSFWDDLRAQGGEWMWTHFVFDGDESFDWLTRAYQEGSLMWVTDGSYNSKTAPEVSGSG